MASGVRVRPGAQSYVQLILQRSGYALLGEDLALNGYAATCSRSTRSAIRTERGQLAWPVGGWAWVGGQHRVGDRPQPSSSNAEDEPGSVDEERVGERGSQRAHVESPLHPHGWRLAPTVPGRKGAQPRGGCRSTCGVVPR